MKRYRRKDRYCDEFTIIFSKLNNSHPLLNFVDFCVSGMFRAMRQGVEDLIFDVADLNLHGGGVTFAQVSITP